ncbi:hypothetical protein MVEN_00116700 [Mycena venus]|uniref:Uncharacterized protein n=1 Tax=Mycena venus TaxID=2733690 RepID=A0A8H6Z8G8_9AGAR|nr:hypothetical protein MVEN_00116700 [Mycena venus]
MSFVGHRRSVSSDADMAGPPGSDSSAIGGIQSDVDDGDERAYTVEVAENATFAKAKVTSIAGIVDTNVPGVVGPSARLQNSCGKIKKADIKLSDIPDAIRPQFKTHFTPSLLEFVGRLGGWDDPTTDDVIAIWNDTFTDYAVSTSDPRDNQLVLVIQKLAQDKVDSWRNKLGTAGIAYWKQKFNEKSKDEIIKDVEHYLAGDDRSRIFYYRDIKVNESGETKYKGIFQSPGFSRVIAVHCLATAMNGQIGPLDFAADDRDSWPAGAITLSCHALKRGLNYFRTGKLVIPAAPTGNFSRSNWADRVDFSEGAPKLIPSTSAIAAVVNKLKAEHWNKIITAARAAAIQRDDAPCGRRY